MNLTECCHQGIQFFFHADYTVTVAGDRAVFVVLASQLALIVSPAS